MTRSEHGQGNEKNRINAFADCEFYGRIEETTGFWRIVSGLPRAFLFRTTYGKR